MKPHSNLLLSLGTEEQTRVFLAAMINSVPGFVTVVAQDGTYLMANQRLLDKVGTTEEAFLGSHIGFAQNDSEFRTELARFLSDPKQITYSDIKLLKFQAQDQARWHILTFTKILQLDVTICSSIDTHEEISLNLEINRQREIIENNGKLALLGEMAGGIAHEINNPMATIDLHVERLRRLMAKDPVPKDEVAKSLDTIEGTVERTVRIVKSLKTFARQSQADTPQATPILRILDAVMVLEVDRYKSRGVVLEMESAPDVTIECRENEVCQVLVNLLNNALDAVVGKEKAWVKVSFHDSVDDFEIRVTDCGGGISKEVQEKMMNPFYTTKEVGKGTGLGLSLSRRFIENHNGRLYYNQNWPNTQFVVLLPKSQRRENAA